MYETDDEIDTPPDGKVIWLYMNLEKLLALLYSSSLHFCRLDCFQDQWEGLWPKPVGDALRKQKNAYYLSASKQYRVIMYVNCWHENEYESAALWAQYGSGAGFAVRSTVSRLKASILSPYKFYIGRVKYLDYRTDVHGTNQLRILTPAFLKRKSFEHEREVRVVLWIVPKNTQGKVEWKTAEPSHAVDVQLPVLIEKIYIAPTTEKWLVPHIRELLRRFDLPEIQVVRSELDEDPVY